MSVIEEIILERAGGMGVKLTQKQAEAIVEENGESLDRAIADWAEDYITEYAEAMKS